MALVPAALAYRDGVPYSPAYGDVYHSADGGAGQAEHVFLRGCGLPDAWAGRADFTLLETGFGTGLNFLTTWAAWRADPARPARLDFLSVEKHPFSAADLATLHARWPRFAALSAELCAAWPMALPGFHRLVFDGGRVRLTLLFGDARACLPQVGARLDAIYLDGFAPDRNGELWTQAVFDTLARLARPGALAATYTVAGPVRAGLEAAGFVCEKRPGYGRKRHCLAARRMGAAPETLPTAPRSVAVIGAGVAGAAVAAALARCGVAVTVFDAAAPGGGASGNPVAVFRPVLGRADPPTVRLTRAAFLHDLRAWPSLAGLDWARCGVLHLAKDADDAVKQARALDFHAPPAGFARVVTRAEAADLAGWPVATGGVFFAEAGWVTPDSLLRAWLAGGEVRRHTPVARLERGEADWTLLDGAGGALARADAVVLANAAEAAALCPEPGWPLTRVRGQITRLRGELPTIARVLAREGYVAPDGAGLLVGATYEHDDFDLTLRAASDESNLARLRGILPGVAVGCDMVSGGRAALRATLPDRLPLVGAVPEREGLFVAAGYASRGVVWAGLLGEALADRMCGAPPPLEADLLDALSPARFSARSASRARA